MVQDNDDIIELTEVVTQNLSEDDDTGIIELTEVVPGAADRQEAFVVEAPSTLDDYPAGGNVETESDEKAEVCAKVPEVSQEMFEAALERVIVKKFSETIEKILFEVMEKVIQKEITDIKSSLQKDLDDIGRP